MRRPRNNRRVVLSESESESHLDNDSDKSIDNANATKRSSSYLCLNTKSSIDDASKNSLEDDPDDATKNFNSDDVKKGRLRNNRRVVFLESEPDLDDDSDKFTDNAHVTKRSPSYLRSNTKPNIDHTSKKSIDDDACDASKNSSDDDLGDASGKSDDATPSATSIKRDPSHRNTTIWTDNDTSSPIGGPKTVKRKADTVGIDPYNIISSSPRASNESDASQYDDERPGKRHRLTRGHGRSTVSYDMKHHPMDDVLRPKYSAERRAKARQVPEESSDSGSEIDEAPSRNTTSLDPHRRRSSRNTHRGEKPMYSAKWHPLDQMLKGNASPMSVPNPDGRSGKSPQKSNDSSSTLKDGEDPMIVSSDLHPYRLAGRASELGGGTAPISSDRRRSARVLSSKDTPPNYDMKYHVMDSTLRPNAAAKRLKSKLHSATPSDSLRESASSAKAHTEQPAKASPKSFARRSVSSESELDGPNVSPASSELQNPYLNRTSLEWAEVQDMDRCVYLLQRGAPLCGNTLPQDWTHDVVKKVLSDEGVITFDELSSQGATELLKSRYESVRLGLQNFFGSGPEPVNKKDWTLSKAEGFDVYDLKRGLKYWKHLKDSVVGGTKTSSSSNSLGFAAKKAKSMPGNDDQEATDSVLEERDRNEAIMATRMQHVKNEGTNPNKSCLKRPPISEVDTERTMIVDLEDDGELGVIIETEDTLVKSMRGGNIPSSIMSDAALEELLFPIEQHLMEECNQEITADPVSSDSRSSEPAGLVLDHPDKTLGELNSVASEAEAADLNTSFNRGLTGPVPLGKDERTSSVNVGPRDGSGKSQTAKAEVKTKKRKSKVDVAIAVHEDLPGRTPLVKKIVSMNPASPGTDIPKENLEDDGSVEHSSQVEIRTPRIRRHHEAIGTPSIRRVGRLGSATTTTPAFRSLFGGPHGSSSPGSSPTTR